MTDVDDQVEEGRYVPSHLRRWRDPNEARTGLVRYAGEDLSDEYVFLTKTRDISLLDESNWEAAVARLQGVEGWTIRHFTHWGHGWFDQIFIKAGAEEALRLCDGMAAKLADYPVLDESDYSQRQWDQAAELWDECCSLRERVRLIQKYGAGEVSIFAARRDFRTAHRNSHGCFAGIMFALTE